MSKIILVFLILLLISSPLLSKAKDCTEVIVIDSVEYSVGLWCGLKIDKTLLAIPEKLVRLPEKNCFNGYRIYVDSTARNAFVKMSKAAEKEGIELIVKSGYRSAQYQKSLIKKRLAQGDKYEKIITFVAPPGYSEHETGKAMDLHDNNMSFAKSEAYKWLLEHAGTYGFVESYPQQNKNTKLPWEPWHWSYKPKK